MNRRERPLDDVPHHVSEELLAYIGGKLSSEQRDAFERRLLEDEFFSRQIERAEFLLVEAYADDSLSPYAREEVGRWIASSPQHRTEAAITTALRQAVLQRTRQRVISRWLWLVAAACVVLAIAIPLVHRRHQEAAGPVAGVEHEREPDAVHPSAAVSREDTILLVAERLRGSEASRPEQTYVIHQANPVHLQVMMRSGRISEKYSIELQQLGQRTPQPMRFPLVAPRDSREPPVLDVVLPPGSLHDGECEATIHSAEGAYRLRFKVAQAKQE